MRPLRIHWLQHVPFEGLGSIEAWLQLRGHALSATRLFAGEPLPPASSLDWLVVMGGPMGIHDDSEHPWLAGERRFVGEAIDAGAVVLGICLGSQLVADALGARVFRHRCQEVGWFPVTRVPGANRLPGASFLDDVREVFHWHGDTFELPPGAVHLARSEACEQQAFLWGERVVGLQFHLEFTREGAAALISHCGGELTPGPTVQSPDEILAEGRPFAPCHAAMERLLAHLEAVSGARPARTA